MYSYKQKVTRRELNTASFFEIFFAIFAVVSPLGALAVSEYIPKDQGILTTTAPYGLGGFLATVIFFCGQGYFESLRVQKLPIKRA